MPVRNNFLQLLRGSGPKGSPTPAEVRIWAAEDGSLWTTLSDGTAAPVAGPGALPNPTDDGDVLTVVEGEWAGASGGGSVPGAAIVRGPFPFAFDTPGIAAAVFAITAASSADSSLTIAGDHTDLFEVNRQFIVTGSTGNDGTYQIVSATLTAGHTVIVTNQAIADNTADGNINAQAGGVAVYTPTIGDILLNAWVEVTEAFDGSAPTADFSAGEDEGWLTTAGGSVDLTADWGGSFHTSILSQVFSPGIDDLLGSALESGGGAMVPPARFLTADPVMLVAAQTSGIAYYPPIDSTQGAGNVYLVTATPAALP